MHRFYLPPAQFSASPLTLGGDEFHHLAQVLRTQTGDRLTVFDGRGNEMHCSVVARDQRTVALRPLQRTHTDPLPYSITLAQALPKGSAMDLIVEKATELGARTIQPLFSDRSVVKLSSTEANKKQERWRQISIEACKQCGNNWLPEIAPLKTVADFLRSPVNYDLKLIGSLQPDARPLRQLITESSSHYSPLTPSSTLLLIGPEGDFTPAELAAAKTVGCAPLSLGPLILRSETAAIAALAMLGYELSLTSRK